MIRTVLYVSDKYKDIDFEQASNDFLEVTKEYTKSVNSSYNGDIDVANIINEAQTICKCGNSELVVVYKEEYKDETLVYHYSTKK